MPSTKPESIWTIAFALLCTTQFLGYAQYYLLQPTLALYVTHLGGSPFAVGLVIASFSITSVLFRPFVGYCADYWSKTGVMILGHLVQAVSIVICFIPFVGAMMLANGFRGIGWAGMNTGGYTLLATNAPAARRGEASGYYGGVQSSATILFPAVALWIIHASFGGFHTVFIIAIVLSLLGATTAFALSHQTAPNSLSLPTDSSEPWWRNIINIFDRSIVLAAILLFCLNLPTSCLTSFVVLYAKEIGISNFGLYFVVTGVTSLLARPLLGRLSDRIGRARSLVLAYTFEIIGLCLFSVVTSLIGFMFAGALYFMGSGIGTATIFAIVMEKAPPECRGRAMASFTLAFSLSSGTGGLLSGLTVEVAGYSWMFMMTAALCALGFLPTGKYWSQLR